MSFPWLLLLPACLFSQVSFVSESGCILVILSLVYFLKFYYYIIFFFLPSLGFSFSKHPGLKNITHLFFFIWGWGPCRRPGLLTTGVWRWRGCSANRGHRGITCWQTQATAGCCHTGWCQEAAGGAATWAPPEATGWALSVGPWPHLKPQLTLNGIWESKGFHVSNMIFLIQI